LFLASSSLQLDVESLPDAPVSEVAPEEKVKTPNGTEAAEDIDDVIELPDVPSKAPQRPETPEKTKGIDLIFYVISFSPFVQEDKSILFSLGTVFPTVCL
jgi:hypothetical protein